LAPPAIGSTLTTPVLFAAAVEPRSTLSGWTRILADVCTTDPSYSLSLSVPDFGTPLPPVVVSLFDALRVSVARRSSGLSWPVEEERYHCHRQSEPPTSTLTLVFLKRFACSKGIDSCPTRSFVCFEIIAPSIIRPYRSAIPRNTSTIHARGLIVYLPCCSLPCPCPRIIKSTRCLPLC